MTHARLIKTWSIDQSSPSSNSANMVPFPSLQSLGAESSEPAPLTGLLVLLALVLLAAVGFLIYVAVSYACIQCRYASGLSLYLFLHIDLKL